MNVALVIIFVGALLFTSHLLTAIFERIGIPDVLFLLLIGLLLGPIFQVVDPSDFGAVGVVFTNIALVGILFESGLGLNFAQLSESMMPSLKITVTSFLATVALVAPLGVLLLDLGIAEGIVLGSIVAGTSSAVVIPLVAKLGLGRRAATTLLLESTFSDVLCIIVTLAVLQALTSESVEVASLVGNGIASFIVPAVIGAGFAVGWSILLGRIRKLDNSISLTLAVVFVLFGTNEAMGYSGAIASLTFGILLGNIETVTKSPLWRFKEVRAVHLNENERNFYSELAFIIKTLFFVYVGVVMPLADASAQLLGLLLTGLIFIARIPVVRVTLRNGLSRRDAALSAVMAPKGLAAAVLAALPVQAGLTGGAEIQATVYEIVLFSIILTAIASFLLGKGLLTQPWFWLFGSYPSEVDANDEGRVPDRDTMSGLAMSSGTTLPPMDTWPPLVEPAPPSNTDDPAWVNEPDSPPAAPEPGPLFDGELPVQPTEDATLVSASRTPGRRRPSDATIPAETWAEQGPDAPDE